MPWILLASARGAYGPEKLVRVIYIKEVDLGFKVGYSAPA